MTNELPAQEQYALQRQYSMACYMLLAGVIATVVNILLLLAGADLFIPYCSSFSYYFVFLGFHFDGYVLGTFTTTGLIPAFIGLAVLVLVWWKAKCHPGWLKAGMVLVILDTVVLALVALVFLENPFSCLFEGLLHIAVVYEIHVGCRAWKRLQQQEATPQPVYGVNDQETPSDSQYTDDLS